MSRPISIAMTTCNGVQYICEQLASLYNQTLSPAEIIVCDDASDDGTLDILRAEAAKGLLQLYENKSRLGVIANFRQAVSYCRTGNDVALCDQDDVWMADKLQQDQTLLRAAEAYKPGPALSFSDLALTDEAGNVYASSFWRVLAINPQKEKLQSLLFGNFLTGCTMLLNPEMRALFEEIPLTGISMHDVWLGLIAFSFGNYAFTPQPLVHYRQHGKNVTAATNRSMSKWEKGVQNFAQFRNNKAFLAPKIQTAQCFLQQFGARLTPHQAQQIHDFCRLKEATWFSKKLLSLTARSYRLHSSSIFRQ